MIRAWSFFSLILLAGAGCSAIVSPDTSELDPEGSDAGRTDSGGGDGGRTDGFVPPADGGPDSGVDGGFTCEGGCDDGVACTTDSCVVADSCEHEPNDDLCEDGERCNPGTGCVPRMCTGDSDCNDGSACNGVETCDPGGDGADPETGCVAGTEPVCDDGFSCTADSCDDATGCVATPDDSACSDDIDCSTDTCAPATATDSSGCIHVENDALCDTGYCITGGACSIAAGGCEGGSMRDCRDFDPCTADSCSEATMMCEHVGRDEDGDGSAAASVSGMTCTGGTDCDDGDASRHPGAMEYCNGRDDDCDGTTDESCTTIPDTCDDAEALTLDGSGNATRTGNFGMFTPDFQTQCGNTNARDAIYYVDITSASDVTIDTIGSTADTVLGVGLECSNTGFRALGCDDDIDAGMNRASRVWLHRIAPSFGSSTVRLYILVDAFDSSVTGDWTLNVHVGPAAADTCATPINITGGGSLVGFFGPASSLGGQRGSCQSSFDTSSESIVSFTGSPAGSFTMTAFSQDFDPDLYVRSAPCASGTELDCVAGDDGGAYGWRWVTQYMDSVTAGSTYYLFVDGASGGDRYWLSYEP